MSITVTDRPTTPWQAGRFDARSGPARLLFDRTFEDPAIEDALFPADGRVLCIASAGDTARQLAASGRSVFAVDINPAQLAEIRRRLDGHPPRTGSADRLLAIGRAALVPLGWTPARLDRFCQLDDVEEQAAEWHRLASPLVRAVANAGLSRRTLRLAYGQAFARVAPPRFGDVLLSRIGSRVRVRPNRDNPWLTLLLTGRWSEPDAAGGEARIDLRLGDVASILEAQAPGSLDGISLSNVLDGPGPDYADRLLGAARRAARTDAPIVVRSFLDGGDREARRLAKEDRSLLWGSIAVHRGSGR